MRERESSRNFPGKRILHFAHCQLHSRLSHRLSGHVTAEQVQPVTNPARQSVVVFAQ